MGKDIHWTEPFFCNQSYQFDQLRRNNLELETQCIEKLLDLKEGMTIDDIACGWGRLSIPIYKQNIIHVIGIDKSKELLYLARKLGQQISETRHFILVDIKYLFGNNSMNDTFLFCTSFGYYEDKVNQEILIRIRSLLHNGAPFALAKTNIPNNLVIKDSNKEFEFEKKSTFDRTCDLYPGYYQYLEKQTGYATQYPFRIRLYTFHELSNMLNLAGYSNMKAYRNFELSSYDN